MIAWSIQAAKASGCFQRVIVSTDDSEIATVARSFGADVPFARPAALSDDHAGTREVIQHAIAVLGEHGHADDLFCCVYATAPFVIPSDLVRSQALLQQSKPNSVVFAATTFAFPIQRAIRLDRDGYSSAIDPQAAAMRSQDLEEAYHDAGQFYWASAEVWNSAGNLFDGARPLLLPRWRVQDIDTEEDWKRAELMHSALREELSNA